MKRKLRGGILVSIGYLLSPLSWWNDFVINIPLAYGFGSLFGFISRNLFLPMMILGYWLTNIIGFMLMHYGVKDLKKENNYMKQGLVKDIIISIIYTLIVIFLVKIGLLKFPFDYFK